MLTAPTTPLTGTDISLSATFSNTGDAPGFGPYVDVILPTPGADGPPLNDGISYNSGSATFLGRPVTTFVTTFDAQGHATHPLALASTGNPVIINGPPGDQLVVFELPFGSYTPGQPPATITFTAHVSNLAAVNVPLTLETEAGFQFGADPLNNPMTDPSIIGPQTMDTVTPSVLTVTKRYLGPEQETATGPNYPQQYLIQVAVARGQTITNLDLADLLPANMQFVKVDAVSGNGTTQITDVSTPSTTTPGGTLARELNQVIGTGNPTDAQLKFTFYIPQNDAAGNPVLNLTTGAFATSTDQAQAQGTFVPLNPNHPPTTATSTADNTITDKSIAVQKSVAEVNDVPPPGPSPGDTLQYTLNFQVSDFFALEKVLATDVFSDGQAFDTAFTPTIRFTQHGQTVSGGFAAANFSVSRNTGTPGATGQTTVLFNVSAELAALGLGSGSILLGGSIPAGGTQDGPPAPIPAFGPTTGTITFRTTILHNYTDKPFPGAPVVQGDVFGDNAKVQGGVVSFANLSPTGHTVSDTSSARVTSPRGTFTKTIYAINGNTHFTSTLVKPGDTVTFRLTSNLPGSSIANYQVTDFLPLPVLPVPALTFNPVVSATPPPVGQAQFGPADTFSGISGIDPALKIDTANNSVNFNFGTFADPQNRASTSDLLFTVQVSDAAFADRLILTNQGHQTEGSSTGGNASHTAIVDIQVEEPNVVITKGVVSTNNAAGTFTPSTVGPVPFAPPGQAGPAFTGTITSAGLAADPINSNLSGIQASDLAKFAIVVENTGSDPNGAFDVIVNDTLPAGFQIPTNATLLNLHVTNGTGAALPFTDLSGGLFGSGIQLVDPSSTTGALGPGKDSAGDPINNGLNIAIITYDLQVTQTVIPKESLTNTTTLTSYSNTPGGPNFVPGGLRATSTVTIGSATVTPAADVAVTKTVSPTDQVFGLAVTYTVMVQNNGPGTATGVVVNDPMPAGLQFVSASPSTGSFDPASGTWTVGTLLNGASASLSVTDLVFALGPITNTAQVTSTSFDPNLSNNMASATVLGMRSAAQVSKQLFLASSSSVAGDQASTQLATFEALMPGLIDLFMSMLNFFEQEMAVLFASFFSSGFQVGGTR
jgi:uncharacterized repeat protein (TIGR01451 family)